MGLTMNISFFWLESTKAELAEEQEVSKIEHLLKNIKRTILEMADGNKSQIYTPELDGKDPNQYRRLEYQVEEVKSCLKDNQFTCKVWSMS